MLDQHEIVIEYAKRRTAWSMQSLHFHDHYEIYYLLEGNRTYFIDSRQYLVKRGDVVLLSKKVLHKTTSLSSEPHSRFALYFTEDSLPDVLHPLLDGLFSCCVLTPEGGNAKRIKTLFFSLLEAQQSGAVYRRQLMQCRLFELLAALIELEPQPRAADDFVSQAADFLKNHLEEPITLSSAAAHFSFSPSHFSRRFKLEAGVGFHEYLTNLRMQRAAALLEETDLSITEIAARCGFEDSNYFSLVFHRLYQKSPRVYRRSTLHPKGGRETSPESCSPVSASVYKPSTGITHSSLNVSD